MSLGKRVLRRRPGQQTTASRRTTVAQKDFGVQVVRHGHNVKHQDHGASEGGPFLKRVSLRGDSLADPAPPPNPKGNDDEQHPDQIEKCLHRRFAMIRDVRRVEAQTPELISAVASSSETQMYHRSPMAAILCRRGSYARIITARNHATDLPRAIGPITRMEWRKFGLNYWPCCAVSRVSFTSVRCSMETTTYSCSFWLFSASRRNSEFFSILNWTASPTGSSTGCFISFGRMW
jgi:hypothetical protein